MDMVDAFTYSLVARGTTVLSEHTEVAGGDFPTIAAQCLQRLPPSNNKFTYNYQHHTYSFLVEDGYAYCVVAKESIRNQMAIAFLERIKDDFTKKYKGGKADTAVAKGLNKEFGHVMKAQMKYVVDHASEIDKLVKVQAQVSEVKMVMLKNIDTAIERGGNLDDLSNKANDLRSSAQEFETRGTQMKRKMWRQNMKIKLVIFGILLLLALIIWLSICRGFNCSN